jgi:hypothetical protein
MTVHALTVSASGLFNRDRANLPKKAGIVATRCGWMWSTMPDRGVTNALAISHAITAHGLWRDDGCVTVREDLPLRPDAGGAFLGDTWIVNGCFYRCMAIDLRQLRKNVGGDAVPDGEIAKLALACLDGFVFAKGGAKDGSTAPYMKPALLVVELSDAHPINAGCAFFDPVPRAACWPRARDARSVASTTGRICATATPSNVGC